MTLKIFALALSAEDNANTERINRTFKEEYLGYCKPKAIFDSNRFVKRAVIQNNKTRPRNYLEKRNPIEFGYLWLIIRDVNKHKLTI